MKKISLLTITLLLFLTGSITASDTGSCNRVAFSDPSSPDLSALREAGWKFKDTELVGEPSK